MVKKLMTRAAFSKLAGVTPAAITKAAGRALSPACEGKRINASHPAAVAYLQEQTDKANQPDPPATGIDPLYEDAVAACRDAGRCSTPVIRAALKVGSDRAAALQKLIKAAGIKFDQPAPAPARVDPTPDVVKQEPVVVAPAVAYVEDPFDDLPEEIAAVADMTIRQVVDKFGTVTAFKDWLGALKSIEDIREKRNKNAEKEGLLIPRELVRTHIIGAFEQAHLELISDTAQTVASRLHAMYSAGDDARAGREFIAATIGKTVKTAKTTIARVLRNA